MRRLIGLLLLMMMATVPAWGQKGKIGGKHRTKPLSISTLALKDGQQGQAYSDTLYATGGTTPYTWTKTGSLPTGLSLNAGTGAITGTVDGAGVTTFFTITVTDSAGSPATYISSFTITIYASTPPPSPTVAITTLALPGATVGQAYTSTLQASGGTAPYTWAIPATCVVPSCGLPPGIVLTGATGVVAGTPTASGTYSMTFTVTDSSTTPQTYSKAFAVTIAASASPSAPLFTDALTSLAAWSYVSNATEDVIAACPGGGNCLQIHYYICGDSTNPACGAAHQDLNRFVRKDFSGFAVGGLSHVFVQGYLYQKAPEADATPGKILQRKLLRLWTNTSGPSATNYDILLTSFSGTAGAPTSDLRLAVGYYNLAGAFPVIYDLATLNYNTFYKIEEEILLNTPGVADGTFKLWINGVLAYSNTALALRNSQTTNLNYLLVGDQVDRGTYSTVNEYRYWKLITIDDAFIP